MGTHFKQVQINAKVYNIKLNTNQPKAQHFNENKSVQIFNKHKWAQIHKQEQFTQMGTNRAQFSIYINGHKMYGSTERKFDKNAVKNAIVQFKFEKHWKFFFLIQQKWGKNYPTS